MNTNQQPDIHLNLNVRGLPVSATLAINERSNELLKEGRQVYKLGLGQSPFPVPQPVVDMLKVNAHQKDYLPVKGLMELRNTVADYYRRTQGLDYSGEDIIIGPGSKELMFIVQLVYYGDLMIPTPSWVSYAPQAQIIGRQVKWIDTTESNKWLITPEEIDKECSKDPSRPRILILNYPNNPTGYTYGPEQLEALAEVARKYKIVVLSDEIYGELHHEGKHISIARYYPEGTIISSGLSKWCGAGGWRLGTFAIPRTLRWLLDKMSVVASETYTATSAPIQYAAVSAFKGGLAIENYLWQSRRIVKALGTWCADMLIEKGVGVERPMGGFYLFPDFEPLREKLEKKGIYTSSELCETILNEAGVAMLPGSEFGRPEKELTVRLAYVDFDGARAITAAEQIPSEEELNGEYLRTYCGNVVKAIEKVCDWIG
ncbi:pyridoxal phosphate-dependent aminotransferase [Limisalsivibrio acetivorans]|uniref:pyridoxal phosphate-dependent aminotransferase n=1 Tax=Limisalsivibrio acetivorans TaxID=1304888 RepID=UPI0003B6419E|nr:aminotransferase class I/II-fold pyridoxal phosphate-dependent enzyme [Limisalsivibrio acetivorans]